MKKILIKNTNGEHLLIIDDCDLHLIAERNIRFIKYKNQVSSVIVAEKGDKNGKILSRVILNPPRNMVVDHINRNPLDNRRKNLRICTPYENSRNKHKQCNNTSGIPGVEWQKDANMWRVRLKYFNEKIQIGYFKDKLEAGYVRDQVIMQLHGEYAITYVIKGKLIER